MDLILHPVRYRILQMLLGRALNTYQIAEEMPGIPLSSLYRHLKLLLEAGLVQVKEARMVNGIEEKIYTVGEAPVIDADEFVRHGAAEHQRFFAAYLSFLLKGYSDYLEGQERPDVEHDRVGYTDAIVYATDEELDAFQTGLNRVLAPLRKNTAEGGRRRQFLSLITFPMDKET